VFGKFLFVLAFKGSLTNDDLSSYLKFTVWFDFFSIKFDFNVLLTFVLYFSLVYVGLDKATVSALWAW